MGAAGNLVKSLNPFSTPQMPKLAPIQPPPTPTASDSGVQAAAQSELERLRKQRGRGATILSNGDDGTVGGLATKTLLGSY